MTVDRAASSPRAVPPAPGAAASAPGPATASGAAASASVADGGRPPARRSLARRAWSQSWRLVLALVVGLVAAGASWPLFDVPAVSDEQIGAIVLLDVAAGLLALAIVPFRHRAPLLVAVVAAVLGAVSALGVGAAALALVSLATRRRPVELAVTGVVFVAASTVAERTLLRVPGDDTSTWLTVVVVVLTYGLLVAVGVAIGARRALVESLRERARLLEAEQAHREERARDHERAHLAREMHDVLGHRLSLVALHAGALEYRGRDLPPDEAAAAAGVVRDEAQKALHDLRDVLGVLREPGTTGASEVTATAPPQPTLHDLEDLLDVTRASGTGVACPVDEATAERLASLPAAVGRHAYRIVQESLTNARRHAPGQPVDVVLAVLEGPALRLVVTNAVPEASAGPAKPVAPGVPTAPTAAALADGAGLGAAASAGAGIGAGSRAGSGSGSAGTGHGLVGLAERARLVGGTFRAGAEVADDGRRVHVVEAVLPWRA